MSQSPSGPPSSFSELLNLITVSVNALQQELNAAQLPEPCLDDPGLHPWDESTPPKPYWNARRTLLSALGMMTALVQNPREKILVHGMGYHYPAALNFIVRTRIPDILAAPDVEERVGLHIDKLSRRAGTHPAKTITVLRFLCTHHIFTETAPCVFANNKLSHVLKSADPTSGAPVFWGEIAFRSATGLSHSLRDPKTAHSFEVSDAPFSRIFSEGFGGVELSEAGFENQEQEKSLLIPPTPFTFLASPAHALYRASFAAGMRALDLMHGPNGLHDIPWAKWDYEGACFVDIGASTGHLAMTILPVLRYASFICQDRPEICAYSRAYFKENYPDEKRVAFQENDFFNEQPVKGASLYILSNILHDWPEKEALCILRRIAVAMDFTSRLLVIEVVLSPSIAQASVHPAPTRSQGDAPWPLLADYGSVNTYAHHQSMEMLNLFNSVDRTLPEYVGMFAKAGLELVQLHPVRKVVSVMEVRKA